jgi:hypothetical protein
MVEFVRVKTLASKELAKRNLRKAEERYNRAKAAGLSGAALYGATLGLQLKEGAESDRGNIAWSVLVSGCGTYELSDIADVTGLEVSQVRAAFSNYLVPRAYESQPFFPYSFEYNRKAGTIRMVVAQGAKAALAEALAPRKAATRKQVAIAVAEGTEGGEAA